MQNILPFILNVFINSTGAVGILYLLLKLLGRNVMDTEFKKISEKYKFKLNLEFDRITKLNQKEFEVLPNLWETLTQLRSMFLFYSDEKLLYENLNSFNDQSLNDFLNSAPIPSYHKELIFQSKDRNTTYVQVIDNFGNEAIKRQIYQFDQDYKTNKIFFTSDLSSTFSELHKYIYEAFTLYLNIQADKEARIIFRNDFDTKTIQLMDILGNQIKRRLRFIDN